MKNRLLPFLLLLTATACIPWEQRTRPEPTAPLHEETQYEAELLAAMNAALAVEGQMPRLAGPEGSPMAPVLIDVELVSRAEAYHDAPDIDHPEKPMWIIRMSGRWGDPLPKPAEEEIVYRNLTFIVDGLTGEMDAWTASR